MSTRLLIPTTSRMDQEMGRLLGMVHTRENDARQRWYGLMQEELVKLTLRKRIMTLWQAICLETRWIPWLIPLVQAPTGRFWNGRDTHASRSLPLWTVLAVLWQMCHVWITYGTVRSNTITMRKSYGAYDQQLHA